MQSMTFSQQLIITLLDKLVIALVLALVGLWVNRKIEAIKGQEAAWLENLKGQQALSLEMHKDRQVLAKELRDLQAQKELQATAQIASARLPAYERLWEVQWIVSPTLSFDLTAQERKDLETRLITCFYQDGNGLFLSHSALSSFQAALKCLARERSTTRDIVEAFSALRTQLKEDMRIYNSEEARTSIEQKKST